jgi:translocation and assembly module TamB
MIAVATIVHLSHLCSMASGDLDQFSDQDAPIVRAGWSHASKILALIVFCLLILLALLYWQRLYFADYIVRDQLKRYGVTASFKLEKIGTRHQRLTNVIIGDPAHPDLTAALVELETSFNLSGPIIRRILTRDVFVRGRYEAGQLRFGELDKFRDLNNKKPFEIPDYAVELINGRMALATPLGPIGIGMNGSGTLRNNFQSKLAVRATHLENGDCSVKAVRYDGDFALLYREPHLLGPLLAAQIACRERDLAISSPAFGLDIKGSTDFANWAGTAAFAVKNARYARDQITLLKGQSKFDGGFSANNSKWTTETYLTLAAFNAASVQSGALKGRLKLDLDLAKDGNRWLGDLGFVSAKIVAGQSEMTGAKSQISFNGQSVRTSFNGTIAGQSAKAATLATGKFSLDINGHLDHRNRGLAIAGQGKLQLEGGQLPPKTLPAFDDLIIRTRETPVGPIIARLAPALRQALAGFSGRLRYDLVVSDRGVGKIRVDGANFAAQSGGRLQQIGPFSVVAAKSNDWQLQSPLRISLGGGALPTAILDVKPGPRGLWSGTLALSNFAAPGASLAVSKLNFAGRPGAPWALLGNALVSGPLPGGRIDGLSLPINGIWNGSTASLYNACTTFAFKRLQYAGLDLPADSFRVCPDKTQSIVQTKDGKLNVAGNIQNFNTKGRLGSSGFALDSSLLRFDVGKGFTARNVNVSLGNAASSRSKFAIADINGRFLSNGLAGTLSGGGGRIGAVPLIISETSGNWSYKKGVLALESSLRVADSEVAPRFKPMIVPDFILAMEKGVIAAIGTIREPKTGRAVADVDVRHDLASVKGRALLSVDGLKFEPGFQPELLTNSTLGVVANVVGRVDGDGIIEWDGGSVKSNGRFGTRSMDLAAAFGPVEGLASDIVFTDLLGLETGPSQLAQLGSVNPGIPALNGKIRYQLLPGRQVGIEGGTWPFAGGQLMLEPTILDFDILKPRRLTFRVVGVDAEKFFANYDFENLLVSGVFDGTLPMVFDSEGGKIVDGNLVSRAGGGEISYLGELTYADKGVFANYAFDALKSMRYQQLVINVDGKIDGEIITKISFSGIQQGSLAKRNFITRQLAKIPLEFNVSITAQFLQLIGSLRGLYDTNYVQPILATDLIDAAKKEGRASKAQLTEPIADKPQPPQPKDE